MCRVNVVGKILHEDGISGELGRSDLEGASCGPTLFLSEALHRIDKSRKHFEVR